MKWTLIAQIFSTFTSLWSPSPSLTRVDIWRILLPLACQRSLWTAPFNILSNLESRIHLLEDFLSTSSDLSTLGIKSSKIGGKNLFWKIGLNLLSKISLNLNWSYLGLLVLSILSMIGLNLLSKIGLNLLSKIGLNLLAKKDTLILRFWGVNLNFFLIIQIYLWAVHKRRLQSRGRGLPKYDLT